MPICVHCHREFPAKPRGRPPRYCGTRCKQAAQRERHRHPPLRAGLFNTPRQRPPHELERLLAKAETAARLRLTGTLLTAYERWDSGQWARIPALWELVFRGSRFDPREKR